MNDLLAKVREKMIPEIKRREDRPIIEALLAVAKVASQGVDGKTRLVVPGDTWHERMKRALGELSQAVQDE